MLRARKSQQENGNKAWAAPRGEEGQAILLVALSLTVLLFMALAVDIGYLRYMERKMRSAADAAALGAGSELYYNNNSGGMTAAGRADAAKDGFTDGTNGVSVNLYNPPNDGPHTCANDTNCDQYVEATISQSQPTFFMKIINVNSSTVSARAVAWIGASGTGCFFALDPSTNNAFVVSGSGTSLSAPSCDVMVNSTSANSAYVTNGGACVASMIGVVGGSHWDGDCTDPVTGVVPVSDPLANVPAPAVGSCPNSPPSQPAGCSYQNNGGLQCTSTPSTDLQPGTYCGGISISGNSTVTFASGTYVLYGGGFAVAGGSNVIGSGVTFYNTGTTTGNTKYQPVVLVGGNTTSLTAPTSGSLEGILFFQDRNLDSHLTGANGSQNKISGGSGTVITGALYFPTTPLAISGGSSLDSFNLTVVVVADTVSITGGANVAVSTFGAGQSPEHKVVLVE